MGKLMTVVKRGIDRLQDPSLNKSTAFTESEKEALGLVGLVPDVTETKDLQLQRVMLQLAQKPTDLERYIYLINLLDHDETLFYRTVMSDPARFIPIIYDPTIGEACLRMAVQGLLAPLFSQTIRLPRMQPAPGLWALNPIAFRTSIRHRNPWQLLASSH